MTREGANTADAKTDYDFLNIRYIRFEQSYYYIGGKVIG